MSKLNFLRINSPIKIALYLLIFSILSSCVLSKSNNLREDLPLKVVIPEEKIFVSYDPYYPSNRTDNYTKKDDTEEQIIALINFSYIMYIILCLYMICAMNKYTDNPQVITKEIWKFMYITNNGYVVVSVVDTITSHGEYRAYAFLGVGLVIFAIGSIIFLAKFCKICCEDFVGTLFSFNAIGSLYSLPCTYVWGLLGVTDPCCVQDTVTVTVYADGHTESNACCVCLFNWTVYFLKRLGMFVSTIIYYIFLIMLTVLWFVLKGIITIILLIVVCACGEKIANAVEPEPNPNQDINQQENLIQNQTNVPPPLEMDQNQITLNTNVEPVSENYTGGGNVYNNIEVPNQYPDMNQPQQPYPNNYNYQPGMDRPPL